MRAILYIAIFINIIRIAAVLIDIYLVEGFILSKFSTPLL